MRSWIVCATILVLTTAALAEAPRVRVLPFAEANEKQQRDWINRALQQAVIDELASLTTVQLVSTSQPATAPAEFTVLGTIQRINGGLRVTGRVEDANGKTIGGFKATGTERDLFAIEDAIAQQITGLIAPTERPLLEGGPVISRPASGGTGNFEGSDLQRALQDRDAIRRAAERNAVQYPPVIYPQQPTYPITYGINSGYSPYGYGYGGYGYTGGYCGGGSRVIIINNYGRRTQPVYTTPGPSDNGQRIRQVASFAGNPPPGIVNTVTSNAPQLVPGGHR
jgi:TolB-like protein